MNIHAQRFGSFLRQLFQPPGVDTWGLTPDIFPVAPLVHPDNSELYRPRGERLFEGALTQAGGVGVVTNWFLQSSPGMITVIEQLEITVDGPNLALIIGLSIAPGGVVPAAQSFSLDVRDVPRGKWAAGAETFGRRAVLTTTTTSAANPGGTTLRKVWTPSPAFSTLTLRCRYVLFQPAADLGTFASLMLFVSTVATNVAMTVSVRGYERKYQDSELSDWT